MFLYFLSNWVNLLDISTICEKLKKYGRKWNTKGTSNNDLMYFYSFLKHDKGMNSKLMEFQTTIQNYNPKSSVEPEIFPIFQHKVEQIPHFTELTEIVHMHLCKIRVRGNCISLFLKELVNNLFKFPGWQILRGAILFQCANLNCVKIDVYQLFFGIKKRLAKTSNPFIRVTRFLCEQSIYLL